MKIKEQELYSHTRDAVAGAMKATTSVPEFRELLRMERIDAVFRINDAGRIYGATFIDHESGGGQRFPAGQRVLGKHP